MISLTPSCDQCQREHHLAFASSFDMAERLDADGWFVDEITVKCPDCYKVGRATEAMPLYPEHYPCPMCGRAIFLGIFRGRSSYWNARRGQKNGHCILYKKSTPQRIVIATDYWGKNHPCKDFPMFTHHRCRKQDRERYAALRHDVGPGTLNSTSGSYTITYTNTGTSISPNQFMSTTQGTP